MDTTSAPKKLLSVFMALLLALTLGAPTYAWADTDQSGENTEESSETPSENSGATNESSEDSSNNGASGSTGETTENANVEQAEDSSADIPATANTTNVAKVGDTEYATLADAVAAVTSTGTITLLSDVDLGTLENPSVETGLISISSTQNITLDLAGYTISGSLVTTSSTYARAHIILNNGTLTIQDFSVNSTGKIINSNSSSHACTRAVKNLEGATLNIEGGTITATSGVGLLNFGTCNISGDTVIQALQTGYAGGWDNGVAGIENRSNGVMTISGGTFSSASESALFADGGQVTITDGTFTGSDAYGAVNGDPFLYVAAQGGSFSSDPSAMVDTHSYLVTLEQNNYYSVSLVTSRTDTTISTEAELIAALADAQAADPTNLVLDANITLSQNVTLPSTWRITIPESVRFTIAEGVVLTQSGVIDNNGTLVIDGFLTNPTYLTGSGAIEGVASIGDDGSYVISDAMDLQWLTYILQESEEEDTEGTTLSTITLDADIVIPEGVVFESIDVAKDVTFDGQNHSISGVSVVAQGYYGGMFNYLINSTVKNVSLTCSNTTKTSYIGGFTGVADSCVFENVSIAGSVTATGGSYGVAGITGSVYNTSSDFVTEFIGCSVSAEVGGSAAYNIGSMYGTSSYSLGSIGIYNCSTSSAITAAGSVGYAFGYGGIDASASLQIIGFNYEGSTINGGTGSVPGASSSGSQYDFEHMSATCQAVETSSGWFCSYHSEAAIGSVAYETLEAAIAAAQTGDTITLLKDVSLDDVVTISKAITLEGAGHTITGLGASAYTGGNIDCLQIVLSEAGTVTFQNITFSDFASRRGAIYVTSGSNAGTNLVVSNCDFKKLGRNGVSVQKGTAVITECTFEDIGSVAGTGNGVELWSLDALTVSAAISNCTFVGSEDAVNDGWAIAGVSVFEGSTAEVNNCSFKDLQYGIAMTELYWNGTNSRPSFTESSNIFTNCSAAADSAYVGESNTWILYDATSNELINGASDNSYIQVSYSKDGDRYQEKHYQKGGNFLTYDDGTKHGTLADVLSSASLNVDTDVLIDPIDWDESGAAINDGAFIALSETVYNQLLASTTDPTAVRMMDATTYKYTIVYDKTSVVEALVEAGMIAEDYIDIQASESGYSFIAPVDNVENGKLTGGTYAFDVSDFVAEGYSAVANEDGTYTVSANTYTVAFNANGGAGEMSSQVLTYDVAATLSANTFTKAGATFTGWNTAADGSGTSYTNEQEVTNLTAEAGATITLYAQWSVTGGEPGGSGDSPEGSASESTAKTGDPLALFAGAAAVLAVAAGGAGAYAFRRKEE